MTPRYLLSILVLAAILAAGCTVPFSQEPATPTSTDGAPFVPTTGAPVADAEPSAVLSRLAGDVNTTLEEIDRNVASAAQSLALTGISGPGANETLARLAASSPHVADAVSITPGGRIAAAMPGEYGAAVDADVAGQAHVQRGLAERRPLLSEPFRAVEGFDAVVVQHPVTGSGGALLGLVSAVLEPEFLLADRVDRAVSGTTLTAWAMAPDGRVLYDRDASRVGRNAITDPAYAGYPEFVSIAKRIAAEPSGTGSYTIVPPSGAPVKQEVAWSTAGLHGTGWRLVVVRAG